MCGYHSYEASAKRAAGMAKNPMASEEVLRLIKNEAESGSLARELVECTKQLEVRKLEVLQVKVVTPVTLNMGALSFRALISENLLDKARLQVEWTVQQKLLPCSTRRARREPASLHSSLARA